MPWVKILLGNIDQLSLFGYELLKHIKTGAWNAHADKWRVFVGYADPMVWVEDIATVGQTGAVGISQSSADN